MNSALPDRVRTSPTGTHTQCYPSDRRHFLRRAVTASAALLGSHLLGPSGTVEAHQASSPFQLCAFVKFIQDLPFEKLASTVAQLGYDGIEATVRNGGQVLPERVEDDLPRLVEALRRHGLEVNVMASSVNRADHPLTEKVLKTAAGLGIRRYRMAYYRYDLSRPVTDQLRELRTPVRELAALNRELGISAVYQNHAGASLVGATLWDLHALLKDIPPAEIGIAYDIRHATVEGGLAWPVTWNLVQPHLGAVYFKDFRWDGRRPENVPLGAGQVDPGFARQLRDTQFQGPISVHVEYLEEAGVEENVEALRKDLATLRGWLGDR